MTTTDGCRRRASAGRDRDELHGWTGDEQDRGLRQPTHEVTHRVGLARAGRTVQQQPTLEVLTGCQEPGGVVRRPDDVVLDLLQDPGRQHDVGVA